MLVTWMVYATLLGAFLVAGALAAERVVALWSGARRWVWVCVLTLGIVIPAGLALRRVVAPKTPASPVAAAEVRTTLPLSQRTETRNRESATATPRPTRIRSTVGSALTRAANRLERYAPGVWLGASLLLLASFIRGAFVVWRKRRGWSPATVDGCDVLVAENTGPAVMGALRPAIVFPQWALGASEHERMLMLRHEVEHIAANDPLLLCLSGLVLAAFPWNAALWFIVHRLRLAIEIDCDARVLRAGAPTRDYGLLLLSVSARGGDSLPLAASLAERRPLLERRILAMTTARPSRPLLSSLPFAALIVAVATAAAQTPRPAPIASPATPPERAPAPAKVPAPTTPAITVAAATLSAPAAPSESTPAAAPAAPAAPSSAIDAAPIASPARPAPEVRRSALGRRQDIPVEVIRGWIQAHHPSIMTGDSSIAVVTIIVDADDKYVNSVTDQMEKSSLDVAGNLPAEGITNIEVLKGAAAAAVYGPAAEKGVIVVTTKRGLADPDGAKADTLAARSMARTIRLRGIGKGAVASDPIYVIDGVRVEPPANRPMFSQPGDRDPQLGILADGIGSVQLLKLSPGQIGPNALRVVIVKLKA